MTGTRICSLTVGALLLGACATTPSPPRDPLVDRVFTSADGRELTRPELFARLAKADVVYLGEAHDNPRHHELQLEIVRTLVERGRRPAIGFEVFSVAQTSLLVSYVRREGGGGGSDRTADDRLRAKLGWSADRRDRSWAFYGPLLKIARAQGLPVFGADLPVATRSRITRVGVAGLSRVERSLLRPSGFENDAYEALMREQLKAAHCGYGDPDFLGRLYENWLARNDSMAAAITDTLADRPGEPVVMILGAGHTEHDMAVYERVAHLEPGVSQVNLAFREVEVPAQPLAHYVQPLTFAGTRFAPDHTVVWFTPRSPDTGEDRCAAFRTRMKKKGQ